MKWKIDYCGEKPNEYIDPVINQLFMSNCKLVNRRSAADKIFNGAHKTVCAWIECDSVIVQQRTEKAEEQKLLTYNPKIMPYWIFEGRNADNIEVPIIYSIGRKLYIPNNDRHEE
jgi:hypothetical protein